MTLVNIHGFMQLLHNRYFKVLVDHKAIEYMIKSKTESPMMRLKTLLLKLNEYMSCHQDGGISQGDTRHSMPPARRWGGFNLDKQLFPPPKR